MKAIEGEPGPVYIELPANLQLLTGDVEPPAPFEGRVVRPPMEPEKIAEAVKLLSAAEKPGIFVGWGARYVTDEIRKIAEHLGAPVSTTLMCVRAPSATAERSCRTIA